MRQTFHRWLLTLALALTPWVVAAQAVPAPDARAVREVVEAQLKAMAADDAVRAFSYASPTIRSQFGDAATFMAMVKSGYPMVLRPAATAFFQPEAADGAVMQAVQLRAATAAAGWPPTNSRVLTRRWPHPTPPGPA